MICEDTFYVFFFYIFCGVGGDGGRGSLVGGGPTDGSS